MKRFLEKLFKFKNTSIQEIKKTSMDYIKAGVQELHEKA